MEKKDYARLGLRVPPQIKSDFLDICRSLNCSEPMAFSLLVQSFNEKKQNTENKKTNKSKINILDKQIKILQYQCSFITKLILQTSNEDIDTELSYSLIDQVSSLDQHMPALFNQIDEQVKKDFGKLPQSKNGGLKTKKTDYNYPLQKDQTQARQDITVFDQKHSQKNKPRDRYTITPNRFRKRSAADYSTQRNIGQQAAKLLQNIYSIDFCENDLEVGHRQEEIVTYLRFLMKKDSTGLMPPREREMYQRIVLDHKLLDCLFDYTGRNDFDNSNAIQKAYAEEVPKIIKENKYTLDNPGLG